MWPFSKKVWHEGPVFRFLVAYLVGLKIIHSHRILCVFPFSGMSTMNGEIPSVPITTLAGVASLTDCKYQHIFHNLLSWQQLNTL